MAQVKRYLYRALGFFLNTEAGLFIKTLRMRKNQDKKKEKETQNKIYNKKSVRVKLPVRTKL